MQTIKTIQIKLVKDRQLFWLAGQIGNKFGLWEVTPGRVNLRSLRENCAHSLYFVHNYPFVITNPSSG